MTKKIQYLKRNELDTAQWDNCIKASDNSLIYGYSWWLDSMADNWDALVLNDYEAVMPLTWRKKYAFYYLYQPAFTASLGLFKKAAAQIVLADFMDAIPSVYRFWDIDVNEANNFSAINPKIKVRDRINYWVDAGQSSYEALRSSYSRLAKRKLGVAASREIAIATDISAGDIVAAYQKEYSHLHSSIKKEDYQKLMNAVAIAFEKKQASTYTARLPGGEVIAFYLVLHDEKFSYSLLGGSTATGKETGAFYLLTDVAIKDAANSNRIFRFEGSDLPGIAFFNQQFGPRQVNYGHIKMNRLPFPLNIFKK